MTSDAISVIASLKVDNGNFQFPQIGRNTIKFDQSTSGGGGVPGTITVGTSEEDVDLSELTTEGWLYMRNIDTTNYVEWGASTGGTSPIMAAIGRMEPGEPALFRMKPGTTLRMQANTAACLVQVLVLED